MYLDPSNVAHRSTHLCIKENKNIYLYKESVPVPPLAMIDDLLCISKCGLDSVKMNAFINAKSNIKKLQFGSQKCFKIHVGKNSACCPDLYLDHWKLKKVEDFETGESEFVDTEIGEFKVSEATDEKYLGDIISYDGKNSKNIESRIKKKYSGRNLSWQVSFSSCNDPEKLFIHKWNFDKFRGLVWS